MTFSSAMKYALLASEGKWAEGSAAGTANVDKDLGIVISDISNPINREVIESMGISSIQTQKVTTGIVDPGVEVEGDFQHGRLFKYLIGTDTPVETSGDFKHTFAVSNDPLSATIDVGNNSSTDVVMRNVGMIAESGELGIALNENLKLSTVFKGKTANSSTTAQTAVTSTLPTFPHATVAVKFNGVAATEVQNAKIAINKVVSRSGGISSNLYQQGHATELKFEYTANLGFKDDAFHNLFLTGTATTGTASPTDGKDPASHTFALSATNGVTLGSGRREVSLTLANCQNSVFNEVTSVGGLTFIDLTGIGTLSELFTTDNISGTAF